MVCSSPVLGVPIGSMGKRYVSSLVTARRLRGWPEGQDNALCRTRMGYLRDATARPSGRSYQRFGANGATCVAQPSEP